MAANQMAQNQEQDIKQVYMENIELHSTDSRSGKTGWTLFLETDF